jgi:hypothetical protein
MELINVDNNFENKKGNILPECVICNTVPEEGIFGVYKINKTFICNNCLNKITLMAVGSPEYKELVGKIKKIYRHPRRFKV